MDSQVTQEQQLASTLRVHVAKPGGDNCEDDRRAPGELNHSTAAHGEYDSVQEHPDDGGAESRVTQEKRLRPERFCLRQQARNWRPPLCYRSNLREKARE